MTQCACGVLATNRSCFTCAANMLLQLMSRFNAKPCVVRPPAVDAADRQGAAGVCVRGELPRHRPLHPWCTLASYCKQQSPAQAGSPPPRLLHSDATQPRACTQSRWLVGTQLCTRREPRHPCLRCSVRTSTTFACAGKDRTGLIIALLLLTLGVSEEIVVLDYAKSEVELKVRSCWRSLHFACVIFKGNNSPVSSLSLPKDNSSLALVLLRIWCRLAPAADDCHSQFAICAPRSRRDKGATEAPSACCSLISSSEHHATAPQSRRHKGAVKGRLAALASYSALQAYLVLLHFDLLCRSRCGTRAR